MFCCKNFLALDLCDVAEAFDDVGRLLSVSLDGGTGLSQELAGETVRLAGSCVRGIVSILYIGSPEFVVRVSSQRFPSSRARLFLSHINVSTIVMDIHSNKDFSQPAILGPYSPPPFQHFPPFFLFSPCFLQHLSSFSIPKNFNIN